MGKGLAPPESPGASAAAEGRRAERRVICRGLVTAALALSAPALVAAGVGQGDRWLLVGGVAAGVAAWCGRPQPDPGRWGRGAAGEVATARLLARLPRRFVVLHDRHQPGSRGNLDHLVIGPSGVWVVDSKVRQARLRIHRGQVWAGDYPIDVEAVARQAGWVEQGLGVAVTPVLVVHGTGLRRRGKNVDGVRILPARRLTRHLRRGRRLSSRDVCHLAAAVDRQFPRR